MYSVFLHHHTLKMLLIYTNNSIKEIQMNSLIYIYIFYKRGNYSLASPIKEEIFFISKSIIKYEYKTGNIYKYIISLL
jgi:hypothetical protein